MQGPREVLREQTAARGGDQHPLRAAKPLHRRVLLQQRLAAGGGVGEVRLEGRRGQDLGALEVESLGRSQGQVVLELGVAALDPGAGQRGEEVVAELGVGRRLEAGQAQGVVEVSGRVGGEGLVASSEDERAAQAEALPGAGRGGAFPKRRAGPRS